MRRPGFPWSWLRSFGLIVVVGLGLIGTTTLSVLAGGAGHYLSGAGATVAALVVSLVLNFGVFWLAFRLGTAREIGWRQLWLGAAIGAVIWQVLQAVGGYFVSHQLAHASPTYGTFAVVIGLLAWLYLQAELTLFAVEINVVQDIPAVAAQHRAAAVHRAGSPCLPAVRGGDQARRGPGHCRGRYRLRR